jgi:hypothetical protein
VDRNYADDIPPVHIVSDCIDEISNSVYIYTEYFDVVSGFRYKFRFVTMAPSSKTQLLWYDSPTASLLQTCEVSNASCFWPVATPTASKSPTESKSPTSTKSPTKTRSPTMTRSPIPSEIVGNESVECGQSGFLNT